MTNRVLYLVRHGEYAAPEGTPPEDGTLTEVGEEQARLTGQRLSGVPFAAIHHSPVPRAARTARLIADFHPGVPVHASDLLRECIPAVPPREDLNDDDAAFFDAFPPDVLDDGRAQAARAVERFACPTGAGPELLVSHGNLINWFVAQALGGPDGAWLRLLDYHCAVTVIMYFPDRVKVASYNDMGHLPVHLRGTDYPAEARV
jgi:probable phosphoglycerate mutase